MRGRITRNREWGLGLTLLDRDNQIQLFIPLERVLDAEQADDAEEEEVSDTESSEYEEPVNQNVRNSTPNDNNREILVNEMESEGESESDINERDTEEGSEETERLIYRTRLEERLANLYNKETAFFRVIRTRDEYEKGLPSGVEHKIPAAASTHKFLLLRTANFVRLSDLSRMAMAFPDMKSKDARIATFASHDGHVIKEITPEKYAEAGFFSYGNLNSYTNEHFVKFQILTYLSLFLI
uniref:Uncharacterized protein n=1 Tax=Tetranychus urticae TaxID=32264 RepID=A0A158P4J1_TETUR